MAEQVNPRTPRRQYRMGRRLQAIAETRRRITAATFELHATIGPARTTVSAIAERAGVQRHTVYAHFPDLQELYRACTEHGMLVTRMPRPEPWAAVAEPRARLRAGLAELFAWYRANDQMLRNVLAEPAGEPTEPAPVDGRRAEPDPYEARMIDLVDVLARDWPAAPASHHRLLRIVLVHATAVATWRSLTTGGLADEEAINLLEGIVRAVADGSIAAGGTG